MFTNTFENFPDTGIKVDIIFYHDSSCITTWVLTEEEMQLMISKYNLSLDTTMSKKLNSKIYFFANGFILEIRKGELCGQIYKSFEDLITGRDADIIRYGTNIGTITRYDSSQTKFILDKYRGIPIKELREENQVAYKLSNAKVLVVYGIYHLKKGNITNSSLYDSLNDLYRFNPFYKESKEE